MNTDFKSPHHREQFRKLRYRDNSANGQNKPVFEKPLAFPKERKVQRPSRQIDSTLSHATEQQYELRDFVLDLALGSVLLAATALTISPFFFGEFTQRWGSIESAFLSDATFVVNNYPHVGWYPYWYGGLQFRLSYTTLLPYLIATISWNNR